MKICPFMSRPVPQYVDGRIEDMRGEINCYGTGCMAWFNGWKDKPNSGYCQLIIHPRNEI